MHEEFVQEKARVHLEDKMEDSLNQLLDLPPDTCHYSYRIAGHTHTQGKVKLGENVFSI